MESVTIEAILLWPGGRREALGCRSKGEFADNLLKRAEELYE